jgi:hypothetical protein
LSNAKGKVGWALAALIVIGVAVYFGRQSTAPIDEVETDDLEEQVDKKGYLG